jgi:paraquat-inducible protein A
MDDAAELVECLDCGLFQRALPARPGHAVCCARCAKRIEQPGPQRPAVAGLCVGVAALFLAFALSEPLFELHLMGRFSSATLLSGPHMLNRHGHSELALVVLMTALILPAVQLLIIGLALLPTRTTRRWQLLPLGLLETVQRWSMVDVYLLAVLVCYVRLRAWSNVDVGPCLVALLALMLVSVAAEAGLSPRVAWHRLAWTAPAQPSAGRCITCTWCGLVSRAREGAACPRCGRALRARKRESLTRTSALLLGAALLSLPANLLPVMDMIRFGRSDPNTIFSGVIELTHNDLWGLALLIFAASILVPLLKIVSLALMLWMTARGSAIQLQARTRLFRFVREIGRWSLVDVFAVTILVSLVHMGELASVLPGSGAVGFCAVVILTMLAAESFDPRLMWDAAGLNPRPRSAP